MNLISLIIPVITAVIAFLLVTAAVKFNFVQKIETMQAAIVCILSAAISSALIVIFSLFLQKYEIIGATNFLFIVIFCIALNLYLLAIMILKPKNAAAKWVKCIQKAAFCTLIILLLECTVFNFSSFSSILSDKSQPIDVGSAISQTGTVKENGNIKIISNNETTIEFDNINADSVKYINVRYFGGDNNATVSLSVKDKNLSAIFTKAVNSNEYIKNGSSSYYRVNSRAMTAFNISFKNAENVGISAITLNARVPFSINYLRVLLLIFAVIIFVIIRQYSLHKAIVNMRSRKQFVVMLVALGLSLVFPYSNCTPGMRLNRIIKMTPIPKCHIISCLTLFKKVS